MLVWNWVEMNYFLQLDSHEGYVFMLPCLHSSSHTLQCIVQRDTLRLYINVHKVNNLIIYQYGCQTDCCK